MRAQRSADSGSTQPSGGDTPGATGGSAPHTGGSCGSAGGGHMDAEEQVKPHMPRLLFLARSRVSPHRGRASLQRHGLCHPCRRRSADKAAVTRFPPTWQEVRGVLRVAVWHRAVRRSGSFVAPGRGCSFLKSWATRTVRDLHDILSVMFFSNGECGALVWLQLHRMGVRNADVGHVARTL